MMRLAPRTARQRDLKKMLRILAPLAPLSDFSRIEEIALRGHLRHLPPSVVAWQALTTHVRHEHTEYDQLLDEGYDADAARHFVLAEMNDKLLEWGCPKRIEADDPQAWSGSETVRSIDRA